MLGESRRGLRLEGLDRYSIQSLVIDDWTWWYQRISPILRQMVSSAGFFGWILPRWRRQVLWLLYSWNYDCAVLGNLDCNRLVAVDAVVVVDSGLLPLINFKCKQGVDSSWARYWLVVLEGLLFVERVAVVDNNTSRGEFPTHTIYIDPTDAMRRVIQCVALIEK